MFKFTIAHVNADGKRQTKSFKVATKKDFFEILERVPTNVEFTNLGMEDTPSLEEVIGQVQMFLNS